MSRCREGGVSGFSGREVGLIFKNSDFLDFAPQPAVYDRKIRGRSRSGIVNLVSASSKPSFGRMPEIERVVDSACRGQRKGPRDQLRPVAILNGSRAADSIQTAPDGSNAPTKIRSVQHRHDHVIGPIQVHLFVVFMHGRSSQKDQCGECRIRFRDSEKTQRDGQIWKTFDLLLQGAALRLLNGRDPPKMCRRCVRARQISLFEIASHPNL